MADFLNPFFADPDASGTPGEADSWTWVSVSGSGAWAVFNTATAVLAYQLARESFEAGFSLAWDKSYANETARLSDATLTPSDVGVICRQEDTLALYVLVDDSPVTWQLVPSDNENWVDDLIIGVIIAAIFNGASSSFDAVIESFSVWGELTWPVPGAPWVDVPNYIRQDSAEGLVSPYSLGFKGWYSTALISNDWLLEKESFEEGWENEPMSADIAQWQPANSPGGIMRGKALTFPLFIPPEKTKFFIWHATLDAFYRITITSGTYATAVDLANELQSKWLANVSPFSTGLRWFTWSNPDGTEGLTFGYNGYIYAETAMFGMHEDEIDEDARALLGFHGLGPDGTGPSRVVFQADHANNYPTDLQSDDRLLLDRWSYLDYIVEWDKLLSYHVVEYNQIGAVFNLFSAVVDDSHMETYHIQAWFGDGAYWKEDLEPGDLTSATFVGGAGVGEYIESFENPTITWPDDLYEE